MGCAATTPCQGEANLPEDKKGDSSSSFPTEELKIFHLMKSAPGCTGMFWRADPRTGKKGSMDNWPRDGAQLRGIVHEVNGEKWLECKEVKQKGGSWSGCQSDQWMPFRYSQYYLQEA